ncbi:hypothetical protein BDQ12DRAFT_662808 [Crucibulum laeve]|uniref:Uncharacterized protein n=1 Tax=Crucibulum laeve TaxID=68775 RepID=A0A5C3MCY0_9AGAR|nr:hypothetical protein BDQ12DRAFT_662808 [Crucibulum laeve]
MPRPAEHPNSSNALLPARSPSSRSVSPLCSTEPDDLEEVAHLVQMGIEDDEDDDPSVESIGNSRLGTPERAPLPEDGEVLRAHDNPSPPPTPSLVPTVVISEVFMDEIIVGSPSLFQDEVSADLTSAAPSPPSTPHSRESTPTLANLNVETTPIQQDLISFDSSSARTSRTTSSSNTLPTIPALSVDQLLSHSPIPSSSSAVTPPAVVFNPANDAESTINAPDSDENLPINIGPDTIAVTVSKGVRTSPQTHNSSAQQGTLLTPLRRSTRPRRSVTPLRRSTRPRRSVTPNSLFPKDRPNSEVVDSTRLLTPSSAQTQRKRRKHSHASSGEEVLDSCESDSSMTASPVKDTHTIVDVNERVRGRERSPVRITKSFSRELGSLSPTSTNLLTNLIPSSSAPPEDPQPMPSFSIFPMPSTVMPSTPTLSISPDRSISPVRFNIPPSSSRPGPSQASAVLNTPARRIPMDQAIAQGHVSPQKAAKLGNGGGQMFGMSRTPVFSIPKIDSPARRVVINESIGVSDRSKPSSLRFGSPVRPTATTLDFSRPTTKSSLKGKEKALDSGSTPVVSLFAAAGSSSQLSKSAAKLPFPIVAIDKEVTATKPDTSSNTTSTIASPMKSSLKQATSRIPRIGIKPYAKPPAAKNVVEKAKPQGSIRAVDLKKVDGPKVASTSTRSSTRAAVGSESKLLSKPGEGVAASLKRKRSQDITSPVAKARPIVMIRQVPKIAASKPPSATATRAPAGMTSSAIVQAKRPPQPLKIRKVVDREPAIHRNKITPQDPLPVTQESLEPPVSDGKEASSELALVEPELPPDSPMHQDPPSPQSSSLPTRPVEEATALVPSETIDNSSGLRRTTRQRKSVQPVIANDVFGDTSTVRPSQRRKTNTQSVTRSDGVFAGMSATALKALTTSNTLRNQRYLAAKLETAIIRKEGARPESPVMKVRTIVQRELEEKGKQRKERAERRARRNVDDSADDVDYSSSMEADSEDWQSNGSPLPRYRRGPGDEEDYETPARLGLSVNLIEEDEESREKRRVKWDRGLFTAVTLDEVKLGTRPPPNENAAMKGCLAPTAKVRT